MANISKYRFGEPKIIANSGNIIRYVNITSHNTIKKELYRQEYIWNLSYDIDIKCIKLGKE